MGIALASALILAGCASTTPYKPNDIEVIVPVDNMTQDELYRKARQWFSQTFVSGKSVVDYEDATAGTIIGNGVTTSAGTISLGLIKTGFKYNLRVDTKDGRFRVLTTITEFTNTDSTNGTYKVQASEARAKEAESYINALVEDLRKYVLQQQKATNW